MWVFYFFAAVLIWLGILSLRGGVRFLAYVRREMKRGANTYAPFASLIVPFRGVDQNLRENIRALFNQNYPAYEIIFATDRADDAALQIIEEVRASSESKNVKRSRVLIAGEAEDCGQKVHNLRAAVREIDRESKVLAFADTDARPHPDWLRSLVAPLEEESTGASTGYRWFILLRGGFASNLRSVWNASIASALGADGDKNFCWGGATAIRRETFERLNISEAWRGTLSDDFTVTRAVHQAHLKTHFVPQCLTASIEDCAFRELLEFTTRQLKITRVYAPHLWKPVLIGSLLFTVIFFGGFALTITRAALGQSFIIPLALIAIIYMLGIIKSALRLRAVALALASESQSLRKGTAAHLFLWPLASALYLYNALAAALSRRINWRGIRYELKSPTETIITREVSSKETAPTV